MKAAVWSVFAAAVLVAGPASMSAAAQTAAVKPADSTIDERIEKGISKDPTLKNYKVDVSVDKGIVTITGVVPTEADRLKATQLATIAGVSRVDNQLLVDPSAPKNVRGTVGTVGEKTKEGAAKVGEKTKDGAAKVGEKTKDGLSKSGEAITDTWITGRVKSKFVGEDLLKDSDIEVDTADHVVTLKGTVMSPAAKARAVAQAKEVDGVRSVIDRLTVGPKR